MALNPDVRLDIVQVDTGNVPQRLRDLCARSRGNSVFAFDIDSFGAIGQRLRGEGISGSWVIAPEQGHLDLTPSSQKAEVAAAGTPPIRPAFPVSSSSGYCAIDLCSSTICRALPIRMPNPSRTSQPTTQTQPLSGSG